MKNLFAIVFLTLTVSAQAAIIADYQFPCANKGTTSLPKSETEEGDLGDFTVRFFGTPTPKTGVLRLGNNADSVVIELPVVLAQGDSINLDWIAQSSDPGCAVCFKAGLNVVESELAKGSNLECSTQLCVGTAASQFNAVGVSRICLYRKTSKSTDLKKIKIWRPKKEKPDPTLKGLKLDKSSVTIDLTALERSKSQNVVLSGGKLKGEDMVYFADSIEGLVINPKTIAVVDSAVKQTFTITFATEKSMDETTTLLVFKVGEDSVEIPVTVSSAPIQQQIVVSKKTTWLWSDASTEKKIQFDATTTPSKTDTFLLSTIDKITTDYTKFEARAIRMCGDNAMRNGKVCQVTYLMIKVAKAGTMDIQFCNTGDGNKGQCYLYVNGTDTKVYSEYTESSPDGLKSVSVDVPEGEVVLTAQRSGETGNQSFRVYEMIYTPEGGTGLIQTSQCPVTTKFIQNGILMIRQNGCVYNAQGMQLINK